MKRVLLVGCLLSVKCSSVFASAASSACLPVATSFAGLSGFADLNPCGTWFGYTDTSGVWHSSGSCADGTQPTYVGSLANVATVIYCDGSINTNYGGATPSFTPPAPPVYSAPYGFTNTSGAPLTYNMCITDSATGETHCALLTTLFSGQSNSGTITESFPFTFVITSQPLLSTGGDNPVQTPVETGTNGSPVAGPPPPGSPGNPGLPGDPVAPNPVGPAPGTNGPTQSGLDLDALAIIQDADANREKVVVAIGAAANTNGSTVATNGLTLNDLNAVSTNALLGQSNAIAGAVSATNAGAGMLDSVHGLGANIPQTSVSDDGGAPNEDFGVAVVVPLGTASIDMNLSTQNVDRVLPQLAGFRNVFTWGVVMLLVVCNWRVTMSNLSQALSTQQATTAHTEVLGNSVGAPAALAMAVAIVAACGTVPTIAVAWWSTTGALVGWLGPFAGGNASLGYGAATVGAGYTWIDHYVPLGLLVTATLNHIGYRALVDVAARAAQVLIKFLVGI